MKSKVIINTGQGFRTTFYSDDLHTENEKLKELLYYYENNRVEDFLDYIKEKINDEDLKDMVQELLTKLYEEWRGENNGK